MCALARDTERILTELRQLSPMGLTKFDVAEELGLRCAYASSLLEQLVEQRVICAREGENNRQNKTYYLPERTAYDQDPRRNPAAFSRA